MTLALGRHKHVFVDWSLIEPGYGVAWGYRMHHADQFPHADKLPYGVAPSVHPPRINPTPLVVPDRPAGQPIRLASRLERARLHALQFVDA